MTKKSKIIEKCFWISSILNFINLILVLPYLFLTLRLPKFPFVFYIYFNIISITTLIFFILMIRNEIIGVN